MRRVWIWVMVVVILVGAANAQDDNPPEDTSAYDSLIFASYTHGRFTGGVYRHDTQVRRFSFYVPVDIEPEMAMPLVVLLHAEEIPDGGLTARLLQFDKLADREGFYIAMPETDDTRWNTGSFLPNVPESPVDDVGYVTGLVTALLADDHFKIDAARVYVVGISNGGMMAYRLACESPGQFAGVAAVIATLPVNLPGTCAEDAHVSVLVLHGTDDPIVLREGVETMYWGKNYPALLPTAETVAFWVAHNGCDAEPALSKHWDEMDDGTAVNYTEYGGCVDATRVVFYEIEGGGHVWPGTLLRYAGDLGRNSREIDATEAVWRFFAGE